jgi:hypothetical protein
MSGASAAGSRVPCNATAPPPTSSASLRRRRLRTVSLSTRRTARHPWRAANTNLPLRYPAGAPLGSLPLGMTPTSFNATRRPRLGKGRVVAHCRWQGSADDSQVAGGLDRHDLVAVRGVAARHAHVVVSACSLRTPSPEHVCSRCLQASGSRAVASRRRQELHSLVDALNSVGQPVSGGG